MEVILENSIYELGSVKYQQLVRGLVGHLHI